MPMLSNANGLFACFARSKTIYERTANRHIKDKTKITIKINLLTVMQVFGNANGLFPWNKFRVQKPF